MAIQYAPDYKLIGQYQPTEITPMDKRMTNILSLADMIEQSKIKKIQNKEIEDKLKREQQIRDILAQSNASAGTLGDVAGINKPEARYGVSDYMTSATSRPARENGLVTSYLSKLQAQPSPIKALDYDQIEGIFKLPATKMVESVEPVEPVEPAIAPIQVAQPTQVIKSSRQMEAMRPPPPAASPLLATPAPVQSIQSKPLSAPMQPQSTQSALTQTAAPEARVEQGITSEPEPTMPSYQDQSQEQTEEPEQMPPMELSASDQGKYNAIAAIDPDYADKWAEAKIEKNYKLWQMKKYEYDIRKNEQGQKASGLKLYATGMANYLDNMDTPEASAAHGALRDMVFGITGSYAGIPKDFKPMSATSLASTYMDPLKRAELTLKRAQAVTEGAKPALIGAQTETEKRKPKFIEAQTDKLNAQTHKVVAASKKSSEATNVWQNWKIPPGSAMTFAAAEQALDNAQVVKKALERPDASTYFATGKGGVFIKPDVFQAMEMLKELWGRAQSGAAISAGEWKSFERQLLNKNLLLTEEGRKTALNNMGSFINRQQTFGSAITKDSDWYNKLKNEKSLQGQEQPTPGGLPAVKTIDDYNRLEQGATYIDPNGKVKIKGKGKI